MRLISRHRTHNSEADKGSLTIFISTLFILTLIFSFESINIANSYLAKRHLIQIGEAAIQRAAHQIALDRYFGSDFSVENSSTGFARFRVPIDCVAARAEFEKEIHSEHLGDTAISTVGWSCVNDLLSAKIQTRIQPPLVVPILSAISGNSIGIEASISASSVIGN